MLYDDQLLALEKLYDFTTNEDKYYILSGAAGVGKTYLISQFTKICPSRLYYCATTHKAVSVVNNFLQMDIETDDVLKILYSIDEETNEPKNDFLSLLRLQAEDDNEASTIHSLLSLKIAIDYNSGEQSLVSSDKAVDIKSGSIIIVDECSMISTELLSHIKRAANEIDDLKFLFIGDEYQLPPVGELVSPVFNNFAPITQLTEIKRQALGNPIIKLATAFREGMETDTLPNIVSDTNNGLGVRAVNRATYNDLIKRAFLSDAAVGDSFVKIVAWRNATVIQYNDFVRFDVLKYSSRQPIVGEVYVSNTAITHDNKVIVKNETFLTITKSTPVVKMQIPAFELEFEEIDETLIVAEQFSDMKTHLSILADEAKELGCRRNAAISGSPEHIHLKNETRGAWRKFYWSKELFCDLRPTYAITAHKAQGSTYDYVFVDYQDILLNTDRNEMMRLMYVALTRAKKQVIVTW